MNGKRGEVKVKNSSRLGDESWRLLGINDVQGLREKLSSISSGGGGLPEGGTTGQVLAKASETNYDTEWIDPPAGGGTGNSYFPGGW